MPLRCTECGPDSKTFDSKRQARGHVKFKSGGAHGDAQEVPSDWESMFEEVEGNDDGGSTDDDSSSSSSDDGGSDDSGSGSSSSDDGSSGSSTGESGGSTGESGFLRRVFDTDVRELLRGGS